MRTFRLLICLLCLTTLGSDVFAQEEIDTRSTQEKLGDKFFDQFNFNRALHFYGKHLKKHADEDNTYAKTQIATCYRLLNDPANAATAYQDLINSSDKLTTDQYVNYYYYAQALRANQMYEEAISIYEKYAKLSGDDKIANTSMEAIEELVSDNPMYTVQNESEINTKKSDFGPEYYPGGIIWASNSKPDLAVKETDLWTGSSFLDLYVGLEDNGSVTDPHRLDSWLPNSRYHEGPVTFSNDGKTMYVTRSNYIKKLKYTRSEDDVVKLKIMTLRKTEYGTWADIEDQSVIFNSDQYSVAHASISPDGKYMYFTSDMDDSDENPCKSDIYVAEKQGDSWVNPKNLGEMINTSGREAFPFIADDGTLYFSSDGHMGLGGLDIYKTSKGPNGKWMTPENLGAPINSYSDDFSLIIDDKLTSGYFSSNRPGGAGDDDIYSFDLSCVPLKGYVYNYITGERIPAATVNISEDDQLKETQTADANGEFEYCGEQNETYKFSASKKGYIPVDPGFVKNNPKDPAEWVKIPLIPEGIILDVTVILEDLTGGSGVDPKRSLMPDAEVTLGMPFPDMGFESASNITGEEGKVYFSLEPDRLYSLTPDVEYNGPNKNEIRYLTAPKNVSTDGVTPPAVIYDTIIVKLIEKETPFEIWIYYDLDKYNIRPDAARDLDQWVEYLTLNPTLEIELTSHTDCRHSEDYNLELSANRAKSAITYMAQRGVDPTRMKAAGWGEFRLVNKCACECEDINWKSNLSGFRKCEDEQLAELATKGIECTDEDHQDNRRTEIKVIKF